MSTATDATAEASMHATQPASPSRTRPLFWSIRRELWENHAIWIAPLAVAGIIIFGSIVSLFTHGSVTVHRASVVASQSVEAGAAPTAGTQPAGIQAAKPAIVKVPATPPTPAQRRALAALAYDIVAVAMITTMFLVAVFYCLGAMHNERRDRSILFWKSLPVPDLTAVLAKVTVPMAILPLVTFVVTVGTQVVLMLLGFAGLSAHGQDADLALSVPLGEMSLVLLYGLVTLTLWWAPVYGWLLLVSVWARRAPFLWAVLPPIGLAVAEKIAFNTNHIGNVIMSRLLGSFEDAFVLPTKAVVKVAGTVPRIGLAQIDAGKFLSTPGLWIGLVVAAGLLAATVWLRRDREPI